MATGRHTAVRRPAFMTYVPHGAYGTSMAQPRAAGCAERRDEDAKKETSRSASHRLVGIVLSVLAAACGGDDDDEPTDEGAPAAEEGELSGEIDVWIMDPGNPQLQDVINTYASDFEAANPGTTVAVEFVPWDGGKDRFLNAIAAGDVPDLAETGTTWTPEFAELGGLEAVAEENDDWLPSLVEAGRWTGRSTACRGMPGIAR